MPRDHVVRFDRAIVPPASETQDQDFVALASQA